MQAKGKKNPVTIWCKANLHKENKKTGSAMIRCAFPFTPNLAVLTKLCAASSPSAAISSASALLSPRTTRQCGWSTNSDKNIGDIHDVNYLIMTNHEIYFKCFHSYSDFYFPVSFPLNAISSSASF